MNAETRRYALLFALVYGVMGASGIVGQALNSLMKDGLRLSAGESALFNALATAPTYCGPLYGLLSDTVPLFGSRRKSYLILSGLLGAGAWSALGSASDAPRYGLALLLFAAALLTLSVLTTTANALMVDIGKPRGLTGTFQSVQWGAANATSLAATYSSGYLLERFGGGAAFRLYALFPLLAALGAAVLLRREPAETPPVRLGRQVLAALRLAAASRTQWLVALFLFAWFFSPGLGTALYYYQRDHLHFSPTFIGQLGAVFAGAGLPAAAVYAHLARRVPLRRLLAWAVLLGVSGHLGYLLMGNTRTALPVYAADGFLSMFAMLAVLDIGARSAPAQIEGTAFSILTSARVFAILTGGVVGSKLYEWAGLHTLVVISAAFTALCGLFVRWLPEPEIVKRET